MSDKDLLIQALLKIQNKIEQKKPKSYEYDPICFIATKALEGQDND